MPQRERPDEAVARRRVENALSVRLTFADLTGDVDYRFARDGRTCALEVVRFTDCEVKEGANTWASGHQLLEAPGLNRSWMVVTDGHPVYKDLRAPLIQALRALEQHCLEYDEDAMGWWMRQVPTLDEARSTLQTNKVIHAARVSRKGSVPTISLHPSGGWMSDGPDGAVEELASFLASAVDVPRKLGRSGAEERHIWVWTDYDTPGRARRPLEREDDALPSRPPPLPDAITHVWLVDEPSDHGWRWSPDGDWEWIA